MGAIAAELDTRGEAAAKEREALQIGLKQMQLALKSKAALSQSPDAESTERLTQPQQRDDDGVDPRSAFEQRITQRFIELSNITLVWLCGPAIESCRHLCSVVGVVRQSGLTVEKERFSARWAHRYKVSQMLVSLPNKRVFLDFYRGAFALLFVCQQFQSQSTHNEDDSSRELRRLIAQCSGGRVDSVTRIEMKAKCSAVMAFEVRGCKRVTLVWVM